MQRFAASFVICAILTLLCAAQQQSKLRDDDERMIRATDESP
jgi:hypothetical protein